MYGDVGDYEWDLGVDIVSLNLMAIYSERKIDVDIVTLGITFHGTIPIHRVNVNVGTGYSVIRGLLTVTHLVTRYNTTHN